MQIIIIHVRRAVGTTSLCLALSELATTVLYVMIIIVRSTTECSLEHASTEL